jgi:hypothetical protein
MHRYDWMLSDCTIWFSISVGIFEHLFAKNGALYRLPLEPMMYIKERRLSEQQEGR